MLSFFLALIVHLLLSSDQEAPPCAVWPLIGPRGELGWTQLYKQPTSFLDKNKLIKFSLIKYSRIELTLQMPLLAYNFLLVISTRSLVNQKEQATLSAAQSDSHQPDTHKLSCISCLRYVEIRFCHCWSCKYISFISESQIAVPVSRPGCSLRPKPEYWFTIFR